MLSQEALKAGAINVGLLQQGVMGRPGDDDQTLLDQLLPALHRAERDEIVFSSEQQHRQREGAQTSLRRRPVSNHIHTAPMATGVAWGVGRQQLRWSGRRSADMGTELGTLERVRERGSGKPRPELRASKARMPPNDWP